MPDTIQIQEEEIQKLLGNIENFLKAGIVDNGFYGIELLSEALELKGCTIICKSPLDKLETFVKLSEFLEVLNKGISRSE